MSPPHVPRGRKWMFASDRVALLSFERGFSSLLEAEGAVTSGADVPVGHGHEELREPRPLEDVRSEGHHRGRLCYGREAWLLEKERRSLVMLAGLNAPDMRDNMGGSGTEKC
jgi:hypothetical protein